MAARAVETQAEALGASEGVAAGVLDEDVDGFALLDDGDDVAELVVSVAEGFEQAASTATRARVGAVRRAITAVTLRQG